MGARGIHHERAVSSYPDGMARPRIYEEERVATAVRLPRRLHEQLHAAAEERQVAANLLVEKAVESFLARLTPVEQLTGPVSQRPGTVER